MFRPEELQVVEEFGNQVAPHQIRITHIPSGVTVVGNTGSENFKATLRDNLLAALEKSIPTVKGAPQVQNASMQEQLAALQAQIDRLTQGSVKAPEKKAKGRPKGSKMVGGKLVLPDGMKEGDPPTHPEGYSVIDPGKVSAPPATMAPMPTRSYKPAVVVAKSNVKGIEA